MDLRIGLLLISLLVTASSQAKECSGGADGPGPMVLQTESLPLDTGESIREFTFWEKGNGLFFRGESNQLFSMSLDSGKPFSLTTLNRPLSRVIDSRGEYLLADNDSWLFSIRSGEWVNYVVPERPPGSPLIHLFWHREHLYSVVLGEEGYGRQKVHLYKYRPGDRTARIVCRSHTLPKDERYEIASGHQWPNVAFYRVETKQRGKSLLKIFEIDASRDKFLGMDWFCSFNGVDWHSWYVEGPVESVHRFGYLNGLAVKIKHPTKSLLWADRKRCRYFDIGDESTMAPNYLKPILFTWSETKGASLLFLDKSKRGDILPPGSTIKGIRERDLWLTSDMKRLFMAPLLPDNSRLLVQIGLF